MRVFLYWILLAVFSRLFNATFLKPVWRRIPKANRM
jgi:hypothetical protein